MKKLLCTTARAYEICRQKGDIRYVQALLATVLKCGFKAGAAKGS